RHRFGNSRPEPDQADRDAEGDVEEAARRAEVFVRLQFVGAEMPPSGPSLQIQPESGERADGEDSEVGSLKPDDPGRDGLLGCQIQRDNDEEAKAEYENVFFHLYFRLPSRTRGLGTDAGAGGEGEGRDGVASGAPQFYRQGGGGGGGRPRLPHQ